SSFHLFGDLYLAFLLSVTHISLTNSVSSIANYDHDCSFTHAIPTSGLALLTSLACFVRILHLFSFYHQNRSSFKTTLQGPSHCDIYSHTHTLFIYYTHTPIHWSNLHANSQFIVTR